MKSRTVVVSVVAVCALIVLVGAVVLLRQHASPTAPAHAPVVSSQRVGAAGAPRSGSIVYAMLPDVPADAFGPTLRPAKAALDERRYIDTITSTSHILAYGNVDGRTAVLARLLQAIAYGAHGQYDEALTLSREAAVQSAKVPDCDWLRASAEFWALEARVVRPHAPVTWRDAEALMDVAARYPEYHSAERAMNSVRQCGDRLPSIAYGVKVITALKALSERKWITPLGKSNCAFALYTLCDLYRQRKMWAEAISVIENARQQFPDSDLFRNSEALIRDAQADGNAAAGTDAIAGARAQGKMDRACSAAPLCRGSDLSVDGATGSYSDNKAGQT